MLQRLLKLSEDKKNAALSMENRVNDMSKLAFGEGDVEQRTTVSLRSSFVQFSQNYLHSKQMSNNDSVWDLCKVDFTKSLF